MDTGLPSKLSWPRRLGLIAAGLFAGLIVAEVAVRALDLNPSFDPVSGENYKITSDLELKYELVPGSDYLGSPINAVGMRDRPREVVKPPGVFRIACVGDSITFGLYVPQEKIFPARLETLLNGGAPGGTTYEVLNFGVTGYNITQIAATLRKRALTYSPDLILYEYCLNDPSDYSLELQVLRSNMEPGKRRYLDAIVHRSERLATYSHLYRLLYYVWSAEASRWGYSGDPASAARSRISTGPGAFYHDIHQPGHGWERVIDGFASIAAAVKSRNVPVVVAIFPVLDQLDEYQCEELHARIRSAAEEHGFYVIDLLGPLRQAGASQAGLRKDELHPTAAGHEIVAEALRMELEKSGLLRVRAETVTGGMDP